MREESVKVTESEAAVALLSLGGTPLGDTESLKTDIATKTEVTSSNLHDMQDRLN